MPIRIQGSGLFLLAACCLAATGTAGHAASPVVKLPRLALCHFTPDQDSALPLPALARFSPAPLLRFLHGPAAAATADKDDDDADDDDDEDADEADDADPPVRNLIAFTPARRPGGPCTRLSGEFAASSTVSGRRARTEPDRLAGETRATLGLSLLEETEWGRFRAVMELEWRDSAGAASALWMSLGPATLGLKASGFDFWSGDEFGFRATAPSASTPLVSLMLATGETGRLLLGLEDNQARRMVASGYSRRNLPDVVLRWQEEGGGLTLHAAGAFRWLDLVGHAGRPGYAVIAGLRRDLPGLGTESYALGQFSYADAAPGYLGIAQPGGLLRFTLPRSGPAFLLETMRGWTGALAYSHGWSERWRSNAFVTYADLSLPEGPARGRIRTGRAAANLVWTPLSGLDITWELAASRIYRFDTLFSQSGYPRQPVLTAQMALARRF